jgi:hypothetical protein
MGQAEIRRAAQCPSRGAGQCGSDAEIDRRAGLAGPKRSIQQWRISDDPAVAPGMIDLDAALLHHVSELAIAHRIRHIQADAPQDRLAFKMAALESDRRAIPALSAACDRRPYRPTSKMCDNTVLRVSHGPLFHAVPRKNSDVGAERLSNTSMSRAWCRRPRAPRACAAASPKANAVSLSPAIPCAPDSPPRLAFKRRMFGANSATTAPRRRVAIKESATA